MENYFACSVSFQLFKDYFVCNEKLQITVLCGVPVRNLETRLLTVSVLHIQNQILLSPRNARGDERKRRERYFEAS